MKRLYLSLILVAAAVIPAAAQGFGGLFEEFTKEARQDFSQFKKASDKDFTDFRDKANAEYVKFLREAWKEFPLNEPITRQDDKPIVPPVVTPEIHDDQEEWKIEFDEIVPEPVPSPSPEPIAPLEPIPTLAPEFVEFSLYGTKCEVLFDVTSRPVLKGTDEESVADFWEEFFASEMGESLLYTIGVIKFDRNLCDWAFFKVAEAFAAKAYPQDPDAAELLKAMVMGSFGYKFRLGRGENDNRLHVLMACKEEMCNRSYYADEGVNYYLLDDSEPQMMYIVEADIEASLPMSLEVGFGNEFEPYGYDKSISVCGSQSFDVKLELPVLALYEGYPEFGSDFRWTYYANTPLQKNMRDTFYPQFRKLLEGKTELQAAEFILNFVQTSFKYEYDEDVWGRDRVFFAEETLFYDSCDCEDRSILFSHLIRDLLGRDVALIYSPGHICAAVNFSEDVPGSYIMIEGRKFVICEPTFLEGAPVGASSIDDEKEKIMVGLTRIINYGTDYRVSSAATKQYKKSLFPFSVIGKYGFKNAAGKMIVPCEYDSVSDFEQGDLALYAAVRNGVYSLFYPDGVKADLFEEITGYIPVNVKSTLIKGELCRGDYNAVVRCNDGKWYYVNTILGRHPEDFCFDEYEMDDVTYENNVYSKGDEDPSSPSFEHYMILKRKSDHKYGIINPANGHVYVSFKYDFIQFVPDDKSKVVLYESGKKQIYPL